MSDYSLCMAQMRKLQTSGGIRKTCFIDLLVACSDKPRKAIQVLRASFFRGFKTLAAFEKVRFNISGSPELARLALNPDLPRPHALSWHTNSDLKLYIMRRIVEELEPVLGPAAVLDIGYDHVVEFHPRTHLARSVKEGTVLTV